MFAELVGVSLYAMYGEEITAYFSPTDICGICSKLIFEVLFFVQDENPKIIKIAKKERKNLNFIFYNP